MLRNFGFPELLVVLGILILLFGIGRLGKIGAELGKGIRSFRQALSEEVEEENTEAQTSKEQA
ncbi:MAG TPA: twin-arginine translocase TatA/TatE family subunit [Chloroflexi bacterium]|nr:twin-arginine translocase TatA/TatE family subunit [Chloroflexota bacterium]